MRHAVAVSRGLAWRSLILVRRMPSVFLPSLVMPLFILVATAGASRAETVMTSPPAVLEAPLRRLLLEHVMGRRMGVNAAVA